MGAAGVIAVVADDLARGVDAGSPRAVGAQRIVERGVSAAAQEEAVGAAGVRVRSDDLARVVDAVGNGAGGGQRIERGVSAAAEKEAVGAADVRVRSDDLARGVDAICNGAVGGQGIVEGGVGVDWHDPGSSVVVSRGERVDR